MSKQTTDADSKLSAALAAKVDAAMIRLHKKRAKGTSFRIPKNPATFWRMFERAQRQLLRADGVLIYLAEQGASDDELDKAAERVARWQRTYNTLDLECDARAAYTKTLGGDAYALFVAPRIATLRRHRFRPIIDDYVVVGRRRDGTPVVKDMRHA